MKKEEQKNKYLVSIIFFIIFLDMLIFVVAGFTFGIDNYFNDSIADLRSPPLTSVILVFTILGDYLPMIILFLFLFGLLLFLKKKKEAFLLCVCMAVGYAVSELLKFFLQRARPEYGLLLETGYSFPSQHAMMSAIYFLVLLYCFKEDIKNKKIKWLFVAFCFFMFLAIGFSRIYLGVHWTSDVIAGWALGISLVNFIVLRYM